MAYVAMIGEGDDAERVLSEVAAARKGRVRLLTQAPGVRVLYDTNMAREFVRDVKARLSSGKLYVIRFDTPQEVFEPGAAAVAGSPSAR